MEFILNFLIWSPDPSIFVIPGLDHPVRWYGLLFAGGFILSQQVLSVIYKKEGRPEKDIEKLTVYMVVATIVGARLGHCLFYNPGFYLSNPIEILKVWEGGLASHGGAIGILIALWLYARKYPQYRIGWLVDRLVIVVALTGAMIRFGNFMNSEMEGTETASPLGIVYGRFTEELLLFDDQKVEEVNLVKGGALTSDIASRVPVTAEVVFKRGVPFTDQDKLFFETQVRSGLLRYTEVTQHIDFGQNSPLAYDVIERDGRQVVQIYGLGIVRHAAQLYEAIYCVLLMLLFYWLWQNYRTRLPEGFNFALFMLLLWSLRFVDEFFKMNQEAFEDSLTLNMGQILSIPLALGGAILLIWLMKNSKLTMSGEERKG